MERESIARLEAELEDLKVLAIHCGSGKSKASACDVLLLEEEVRTKFHS